MILGFKQKFDNGDPTNFKEKILEGVKIHTIRRDSEDRWRAGRSIQMAYGVRTKNYEQFNKGIPHLQKCTGVQKIEMRWERKVVNESEVATLWVKIDGKDLDINKYGELYQNDGLSIVDFFRWFEKDFTGKIIHWTDFRY